MEASPNPDTTANPAIQELLTRATDSLLWQAAASLGFDHEARNVVLTDVQRIAKETWVASGLIGNRGFFDHTPVEMADWARAYDDLGLPTAAAAIRQAARIMPTIAWEEDDPAEQQLDPIERRYYAANQETKSAIARLVRMRPNEAFAGLDERVSDPVGWVRRFVAAAAGR